jgi:hypothetical protein
MSAREKPPVEPLVLWINDPGPDESLNSFLARLGKRNGVSNISNWASGLFGIRFGLEPYSEEAIEKMAVASRIPAARLHLMQEHQFILKDTPDHVLEGAVERDIVRDSRRVCPACLRARGQSKAAFEFRFVRICPEHHTHLVCHRPGAHPTNAALLDWNTDAIDHIGDGSDFSLASIRQEPVAAHLLEGQTFLLNAIEGKQQEEPPLLKGLLPKEAWFLLRKFGYFAHVSRGFDEADPFRRHIETLELNGKKDVQYKLDISDLYTSLFLTAGLRILSEPVQAFEAGIARALARREIKAIYVVDRARAAFQGWKNRPYISTVLDNAYLHRPAKHRRLA